MAATTPSPATPWNDLEPDDALQCNDDLEPNNNREPSQAAFFSPSSKGQVGKVQALDKVALTLTAPSSLYASRGTLQENQSLEAGHPDPLALIFTCLKKMHSQIRDLQVVVSLPKSPLYRVKGSSQRRPCKQYCVSPSPPLKHLQVPMVAEISSSDEEPQ